MSAIGRVPPFEFQFLTLGDPAVSPTLRSWADKKGDPEYNFRLEAAEKIGECYADKSVLLDLSRLNLTALPPEIGSSKFNRAQIVEKQAHRTPVCNRGAPKSNNSPPRRKPAHRAPAWNGEQKI